MLLSYLEGEDGKKALQYLSEAEQFGTGLEAGKELWKMHQYKAPKTINPWYDRKVKNHRRYMEEYMALGVRFRHDDVISAFIE